MIVTKEKKDVVVSGNFQKSNFKIQADPKAFNILSDKIYTNKVAAVIRETSTNAHDAHVDAGNEEPFDVHLPTALEPWFAVRDYGTGLSHENCMKVYTTYFMSTKTESNDFVGALGLGSKSPFCLSESFSVISFFNKMKRTYSAYKDEDDCPQFALLTEEPTDEPNGLEVIVSVTDDDVYEFEREAIKVYFAFDKIPNLNRQAVVKDIQDRKAKCDIDHELFTYTKGYGSLKAIMGNVMYEVDLNTSYSDPLHYLTDLDMVLKFNIGDLSFNAGRESLSMDKRTTKILEDRLAEVDQKLEGILQDKINEYDNFYDAMKFVRSARYGLQVVDRIKEWNGKPLEANECSEKFPVYHKDNYSKSVSRLDRKTPYYDGETEYFFNKKGHTGRIRQYLKTFNNARRVVLIEESHISEIGFDKSYVRDLSELPLVDRVHNTGGTVDNHKVYSLSDRDNRYDAKTHWDTATVDLSDTQEHVYVEINRWKPIVYSDAGRDWNGSPWRLSRDIKSLRNIIDIPTVYGIKSSLVQQKKFKNSSFISLTDYIRRELLKLSLGMVEFSPSEDTTKMLYKLSEHIEGGLFAEFKDLYDDLIEDSPNEKIKLGAFKMFNVSYTEDTCFTDKQQEVLDKYPFLEFIDAWHLGRGDTSRLADYINKIEGESE